MTWVLFMFFTFFAASGIGDNNVFHALVAFARAWQRLAVTVVLFMFLVALGAGFIICMELKVTPASQENGIGHFLLAVVLDFPFLTLHPHEPGAVCAGPRGGTLWTLKSLSTRGGG